MKLLTFIENESKESYRQIIFIAAVSGMANGLLLVIINHAAAKIAKGEDLTQLFILYLLAFLLFLYGQWMSYAQAVVAIEQALHNTRLRLINKIHQMELPFMEKIGSHHLYARLSQNHSLMTQAIPQITSAAQVAMLLVFSLLYLAYISAISFGIALIAIGFGVFLFLTESREIKQELQQVEKKETEYFALIDQLINGFKEVRLNRSKNQAILSHINEMAQKTQQIRTDVGRQEVKMWGFGRIFVYAIMPILIFIIPSFYQEQAADIFKISATLLFIASPINILVNALPLFNRVDLAIDDLLHLEQEMNAAMSTEPDDNSENPLNFQQIVLTNVCFSYVNQANETDFLAGPFQERIKAGELLFIIGGNGSGKSTFLKLLTGLYYPSQGRIQLNGSVIAAKNYQAYRELFATVFTDFHLFDQFYGISHLENTKVNYWVEKMQMQHKVKFHNGGFTTLNLSTGQRKRLALIAAILENKPILVLDEFAADQDPNFRKHFYQSILPELKTMGKTVVAVTHDDHYFHVADRILKMDEGKLIK